MLIARSTEVESGDPQVSRGLASAFLPRGLEDGTEACQR